MIRRVVAALALAMLLSGEAGAMSAGVNLSGLELNPGTVPGTPNVDFAVPTQAELAYYRSRGLTLVRLPVVWERLQPGLLTQPGPHPLAMAYLSLIRGLIGQANAFGMQVIVDLHDYGGYGGNQIGAGMVTPAMFANLWIRLAGALRLTPGLGGYDLMNEPQGMPSARVWPQAAQRALLAIRAVDATTPVFIEGDNWASATTWQQYNADLSVRDPAGRVVYEAHAYGDADSSGTDYAWADAVAAGLTVDTLAQRIGNFSSWCQARQVNCLLGEIGVGRDSPNWNIDLANGLAAAAAAGIQAFTYWAGGPWWGSYPMSLEPQNGQDAPQMAVVTQYGTPDTAGALTRPPAPASH